MQNPHSLDVLSPKVMRTPSDNQINFPSISNDSLVIHPEEEAPGLTEVLPEVDEDTIYEESDLAVNPNFFQHLSLRFYGHDSEIPGIEGRRCSEPAIPSGMRELIIQDESLIEAEKGKRFRFYQVRSQTNLEAPHLDPRTKGSNKIRFTLNEYQIEQSPYSRGDDSEDFDRNHGSKTCTAAQDSLRNGSMDARARFLSFKDDQGKFQGFQVANKRIINKSGGPESIKGIINGNFHQKRFSKGSPSFGQSHNKSKLSQTSQDGKPKKIINPIYSSTRKGLSGHFKNIQASMTGNLTSFAGRRVKVTKNI